MLKHKIKFRSNDIGLGQGFVYLSEIAFVFLPISVLSESETESKQKSQKKTRPGFIAYLLSDRYPIQKIEIPNSKFEIPN